MLRLLCLELRSTFFVRTDMMNVSKRIGQYPGFGFWKKNQKPLILAFGANSKFHNLSCYVHFLKISQNFYPILPGSVDPFFG